MVLAPTDSQNPMNPMNNVNNAQNSYINSGGIWRAPQSWYDIQVMPPLDPRMILLNAGFGSPSGIFARSTTFLQASFGTNVFAFTGNNTQVVSLDGTDAATGLEAQQWTFSHQMVNVGASIPPPLRKVVFMKASHIFENQVEINLGGLNYTNMQLSFRDNLATSGTYLNGAAGSVPVIAFSGTLTGNVLLKVTIIRPGKYSMVLIGTNSGTVSAFEMEWIVLS